MKGTSVKFSSLFDPTVNERRRIDAPFGMCLVALQRGDLPELRSCFNQLFATSWLEKQWWQQFAKNKGKVLVEDATHNLWEVLPQQLHRI